MLRTKLLIFILPLLCVLSTTAQEGPSTWFELEFSKEIVKNLKVEFNPELRLLGGFKMDSYILEGGLSYKLHKYLSVASSYRFENAYDYKKSTGEYQGQKSVNRIALDAKTDFELKRFNIQFRLRYTNGFDFDATFDNKDSFFRYRAKMDYNIKGNKLMPFVTVEAFHDLVLNGFDKIRYTGGFAYPINKNNELGIFYRLQDYFEPNDYIGDKKESIHIIGVGYSLKF